MTIKRLPDWALRLDALVAQRLRQPFVWGSNDCALFAADAVLAMTGVDLAAGLRGKSAKAAMRFLRVSGGLEEVISDALGPMCGTSQVVHGDVVMVYTGRRAAAAIALGGGFAGAPGRTGFAVVPIQAALCGWKVG